MVVCEVSQKLPVSGMIYTDPNEGTCHTFTVICNAQPMLLSRWLMLLLLSMCLAQAARPSVRTDHTGKARTRAFLDVLPGCGMTTYTKSERIATLNRELLQRLLKDCLAVVCVRER